MGKFKLVGKKFLKLVSRQIPTKPALAILGKQGSIVFMKNTVLSLKNSNRTLSSLVC